MSLKTEEEMEEVIDRILERSHMQTSRYTGMTYEDGVEDALRWAMGEADEAEVNWPFNDE
jgi:hypothetical protein